VSGEMEAGINGHLRIVHASKTFEYTMHADADHVSKTFEYTMHADADLIV
jgi:hypothetical protein